MYVFKILGISVFQAQILKKTMLCPSMFCIGQKKKTYVPNRKLIFMLRKQG